MTSQPDPAAPRLADRLSALVGQATARQDDTASSDRLLASIAERLDGFAIDQRFDQASAEVRSHLGDLREQVSQIQEQLADRGAQLESLDAQVGSKIAAAETSLRGHVDEVGGALVLRLDEVAVNLGKQVGEVEVGLRESLVQLPTDESDPLDDVAPAIAELSDRLEATSAEVLASFAGLREEQAADRERTSSLITELQTEIADLTSGFDQLRSEVGETRTAVEASGTELAASGADLAALSTDVGRLSGQLGSLSAELSASAADLSTLTAAVAGLTHQLSSLEDSLGRRVDEAALALAETLVALLTSAGPASPVAGQSFGVQTNADESPSDQPDEFLPADLGEAAFEPTEPDLEPEILTAEEIQADEEIQAVGVEEGAASITPELPTVVGTAPVIRPPSTDERRKGFFRR